MTDPRYTDPNRPLSRYDMVSANAAWGWLAGIAVLAIVVIVLLGSGGNENSQTAGTNASSPPATTGAAPMRNVTPTGPTTPPSTTGSGSQGGTAR